VSFNWVDDRAMVSYHESKKVDTVRLRLVHVPPHYNYCIPGFVIELQKLWDKLNPGSYVNKFEPDVDVVKRLGLLAWCAENDVDNIIPRMIPAPAGGMAYPALILDRRRGGVPVRTRIEWNRGVSTVFEMSLYSFYLGCNDKLFKSIDHAEALREAVDYSSFASRALFEDYLGLTVPIEEDYFMMVRMDVACDKIYPDDLSIRRHLRNMETRDYPGYDRRVVRSADSVFFHPRKIVKKKMRKTNRHGIRISDGVFFETRFPHVHLYNKKAELSRMFDVYIETPLERCEQQYYRSSIRCLPEFAALRGLYHKGASSICNANFGPYFFDNLFRAYDIVSYTTDFNRSANERKKERLYERRSIVELLKSDISVPAVRIAELCELSEKKVRGHLKFFREEGMVIYDRASKGYVLTADGLKYWSEVFDNEKDAV